MPVAEEDVVDLPLVVQGVEVHGGHPLRSHPSEEGAHPRPPDGGEVDVVPAEEGAAVVIVPLEGDAEVARLAVEPHERVEIRNALEALLRSRRRGGRGDEDPEQEEREAEGARRGGGSGHGGRARGRKGPEAWAPGAGRE
jgi:hypothetical protein